ncbi:glycosyltransferase family 4 protein [Microscilla marina]|uniref:Glycosyl transferase, group 1 family protein n=1 Tax=Microscilla marina ATCC 23134 TaxID=313606 RepID=A1ZHR9_MICM2|nr:glycosyltransferase family 4 protein [Microscilla marina]EAY30076.1 glycosyl transferase, group 1 family protein [Microscilla marina ATCC 23134]
MPTNITYILSDIDKAIAFEWIEQALRDSEFRLSFVLLNQGESQLETYLKANEVPVYRIGYRGKKDAFKAIRSIWKVFRAEETDIVHTHLFDASMFGLLAAKLARIPKRIYTRHHGTLHHEFFPRAVYYDKLIHSFATDIIAISGIVKDVLIEREKVAQFKVHLVHHGFDLQGFSNTTPKKVTKLKEKYGIVDKHPVIGVIARQTYWKGIQHIIPAFGKLLTQYPKAHLILANAKGDYKLQIDELLEQLPQESFTEIVFENDIYHLYQLFDLYVHTPINNELEAFGQTYVEALAAGIPAVFSLSGVAPEFIEHEQNALVVPFEDSEAVYKQMLRLLQDQELAQKLIQRGQQDVQQRFALENMILALKKIYTI